LATANRHDAFKEIAMATSPSYQPKHLYPPPPASAPDRTRGGRAGVIGRSTIDGVTVPVGCLTAIALLMIHTYLAPMHLQEQPYIGVLFLVASVLLAGVAVCLAVPRLQTHAWWSGAAVCVGMAVGYVASRTVGLPNGYHESWRDTWGTTCLVLEAVYLAAMAVWSITGRRGWPQPLGVGR
jgi:hypothetical protein